MIVLNDITKIYKMGSVKIHALKNVALFIEKGEFVAIMGPSGSGKSTLLNILGCLDIPTSGDYILDGINVSGLSDNELSNFRNRKIGFIFQNFNLLPNLSAKSNVELPLIYSGNTKKRGEIVDKALAKVSLITHKRHRPTELSGGQQQRVAIARALINTPSILLADEPTGNLDSKTQNEIMALLKGLNDKGMSIILVTHEESVAEYAKRIIRMQDGEVVSDSGKKTEIFFNNINKSKKLKSKFGFGGIKENLFIAFSSIFTHKLRSLLTMLGIIIGISSVITMVSLGEGARADITTNINKLGANILFVFPGQARRGHARIGASTSLKLEDAGDILKYCPSVLKTAPTYRKYAQVVYKNNNMSTSIIGTTSDYLEIRNSEIEEGRFFTEREVKMSKKVAVIGKEVEKELFNGENPIGNYIRIKRKNFQIIGVLKYKGSSGFSNQDEDVVIPVTTAQKRLFGVKHISILYVKAKSKNLMEKASKEIKHVLRMRHKISKEKEDDFNITSQKDILSVVNKATAVMTLLLAGIASISLIVGGIGIMNIMLVSVTERTREIGIRKAVGAKRRDILVQFLIEAITLSLIGGFIGILLGYGLSNLIEKLSGLTILVSSFSVLLAFSFAFAVGVFFGYYPARKASKLNPIDALRYE